MNEAWVPVPGFERFYEVSNQGRVRSLKPPRGDGMMRLHRDRYGYPYVNLTKNRVKKKYKVHQLVCAAFHGPRPDGKEVGHRNGVRHDATADNLRWVTKSENNKDQVLHGTFRLPPDLRTGEARPSAKYSDKVIEEIREEHSSGVGYRRLSKKYGISISQIARIITRKSRAMASNFPPQGATPTPDPVGEAKALLEGLDPDCGAPESYLEFLRNEATDLTQNRQYRRDCNTRADRLEAALATLHASQDQAGEVRHD